MKIRQNIVLLLVFLASTLLLPYHAASQSFNPSSPSEISEHQCHEPLTWRIGKIDARFGIDAEALIQLMEEAAALWSDAAGTPLVEYDPNGQVTVNLFYSDQQRFTDNKESLLNEIKTLRQRFYAQQLQFQTRSSEHQRLIRKFNRLQQQYNESVDAHNNIMMRANGNGFMSDTDDRKVKEIKQRVSQLDKKLQPIRNEIQSEEESLIELSEELNSLADQVNEMLFRYRDRYDTWKTFHQGAYFKAGNQKKINIYSFQHLSELKLILAHELGHALGIEHVSSPGSVMHHMADAAQGEQLQLSNADINALMNLCESLQLTSADIQ
jgi:chaperonin cofactor prefoldin